MGFRRLVRVFRILGGKTRQPTRRLRVLEVENRHRPSPASGRPVLGPDRTVFSGGLGIGFLWTALMTPLTFGNHLKFGPGSCHNAKGRPTFLHIEREREKPPKAPRESHKCTTLIIKRGPLTRPHAQELSPRVVVERRHGIGSLST